MTKVERQMDKLVKDSAAAGKDYVAGYLFENLGNIENFDGQSEARDIAVGNGLDAEYVYQGMLDELRHRGYKR